MMDTDTEIIQHRVKLIVLETIKFIICLKNNINVGVILNYIT